MKVRGSFALLSEYDGTSIYSEICYCSTMTSSGWISHDQRITRMLKICRPRRPHDKLLLVEIGLIVLLALPIGLFLLPSTVDAATLPGSYGTTTQTLSSSLYIGSSNSGQNFLDPLTPIDLANPQYVWAVTVVNTTGSTRYLYGWIDFNNNGSFESNERASVNVPASSTFVTLTWSIPITATPNVSTYARLRISDNSNLGPTGDGGVGEPEGYAVSIIESMVCAPGRSFYFIDGTTANNASIRTLDLASGTVTTMNNPPSQARINGIAVDHYRGFVYYQDASTDTTSDGLYYWNAVTGTTTTGNGTVTNDAGTAPLSLPLTNGWMTASAAFANGKYYAGIDGGDLGTIYEITLDAAGTAPVSSRQLFTPNPSCGQTYCNDYGDLMVVGNRMYVAYWSQSGTNQTQHLDVWDLNSQRRLSTWSSVYAYNNNSWAYQMARDGNGTIYAVRQDNGNVYTVDPTSGTVNEATSVGTTGVVVFDASECPVTAMDFGDAPNYFGTDVGPRAARNTINANLRLGGTNTAMIIRDLHGFSSTNADGDDTHAYNGVSGGVDDEDSVPYIPRMTVDSTTYVITNVVVYNNSGSPATLWGWVDFNRDGVFSTSERYSVTVASSTLTRTLNLTWTGLSGIPVFGQTYMRLRLTTASTTTSNWGTTNDGSFLPTGFGGDGEVEDYTLYIDNRPTAVTLSSFGARTDALANMEGALIPIGGIAGILLAFIAGSLVLYRRKRATQRIPVLD
jgi:hypothetical protein